MKGVINITQVNLSVKIDENDKKNFELFCNETGLNVSVAINMFIKTVLRENKLPFEIKSDHLCSENNIKYLEKIVDGIKSGKTKFEEYEFIEEDDE